MQETALKYVFATSLPAGLSEDEVSEIFGLYGTVLSTKVVTRPGHSWTAALVHYETREEAAFVVDNLNGNIPQGLQTPVEVRYSSRPFSNDQGKGGDGGDDRFSPYPSGRGGKNNNKGKGKGKGKSKGKDNGDASIPMDIIIQAFEESGELPGGTGANTADFVEVSVVGLPPDCTDLHLLKMMTPFGPISPKGVKIMTSREDGSCLGYGFVKFLTIEGAKLAIDTLSGTVMPSKQVLKVDFKVGRGPKHRPTIAGE